MKISILGTGMVARTMAKKMSELEHEVYMGTRNRQETLRRSMGDQSSGETFNEWLARMTGIHLLHFSELPEDTEIFINATNGLASVPALRQVGARLDSKILLDIANPLDFSHGMPPTLAISNIDSLGETIQREFPHCIVVKSLNTMNAHLMVNPQLLPGNHSVFISGDDPQGKAKISSLLEDIGWMRSDIIDLGDISTCRGTEMLLPVWLRLWQAFGTAEFNFHIVRK